MTVTFHTEPQTILLAPQGCRRVLIVDDEADARETMAMLLLQYGFQAEVAADCDSAAAAVKAHLPDVLLMDIDWPGCDGYQVAKHIRGLFQTRPLLIAVTGYGMASDSQRSKDEGFDHHLVKPLDPEKLLRLLHLYAASRCDLLAPASG